MIAARGEDRPRRGGIEEGHPLKSTSVVVRASEITARALLALGTCRSCRCWSVSRRASSGRRRSIEVLEELDQFDVGDRVPQNIGAFIGECYHL